MFPLSSLRRGLYNLKREKGLLAGIIILLTLTVISLYAAFAAPYHEIVRKWNTVELWEDYPRNALPVWINLFRDKKLPETIIKDSRTGTPGVLKEVKRLNEIKITRIVLTFNYEYDDIPSEILLKIIFTGNLSRRATVTIKWISPDGDTVTFKQIALSGNYSYFISLDLDLLNSLRKRLVSVLGREFTYDVDINTLLFAVKDSTILEKSTVRISRGNYSIDIETIVLEPHVNVDAKLIVYGKVYGMAGTDGYRRDLWIGVVWGTPAALAFGLSAALIVALIQMFVGAVSAWLGGVTDFVIQRLTEIFMNIPFYPLLIMISFVYKLDLWTLLLVIVGLGIFGAGVKSMRSIFLTLKEVPFIEAAKAYGASSLRIITLYMIPRILPTLIPNLITSVPYYVFLEASLAIIGVSGTLRSVVTWGRILNDAYSSGALYLGLHHWVLIPSLFLFITSLGFALIGLGLDRMLNPRLKEI